MVIWNKKIMSLIHSSIGEVFLGICSEFGGNKCYLINIYSSYELGLKRSLWDQLLALKSKWNDGE